MECDAIEVGDDLIYGYLRSTVWKVSRELRGRLRRGDTRRSVRLGGIGLARFGSLGGALFLS